MLDTNIDNIWVWNLDDELLLLL